MRRGSVLALVGLGILAGGIAAAVAVLLPWLPTPASREAGRIDFVFWFVTIICIVIFAVVAAGILYAVVRFRAAPDDDSDGPPTHGHTGLEIAWTLIPTLLVTAIGIVSAIVLAKNDALAKDTLHIDVTAQQFAWSFQYPDGNNLTSGTLRVPVNRSLLLTFTCSVSLASASFFARTTALTIPIAVTSSVGISVHAISRSVCPWVGGPSDSSSGAARKRKTA